MMAFTKRLRRSLGTTALIACSVLLAGNAIAANGRLPTSGLIFQDDFSSGDLTKFNNFFRWGDGTNFLGKGVGQPVVNVTGPRGTPVNAMKFTYGTFQEVRFALTESQSERRSNPDASSNVAYPELWTCYDVFIPTNYFHSTNGPGAVNDKWFVVYKNGYLTSNSGVANFFELVPDGKGNSIATMTDNANGGLNRTTTSVIPIDAVGKDNAAFGVRTSEAGQWHNYCYYTKVPTNATSKDGEMAVYKDGTLHYIWKNIVFWAPDKVEANAGFDRGYILGYHNSIVPSGQQIWYVANFKIGTSAASVGLGGLVPEAPTAFQAR
jgi:hypothetical protein